MTRNLLIILISLLVTACNGRYEHGPASGDSGPAEFVSNGERIYFTGSSVTGSPINAIGGAGHMSIAGWILLASLTSTESPPGDLKSRTLPTSGPAIFGQLKNPDRADSR